MASKFGTFVAANGHTYEVKISGDGVNYSPLTLGVPPVVLSMAAGKHKFCGFKTTTAIVNIVTDDIGVDFYADTVDGTSLVVTDLTDNVVEFDGYVVPFAFDQSYDANYTTISVEAVDRLSARKHMKYYDGTSNVDTKSAFEIIAAICQRAGIKHIVEQGSFEPDTPQKSQLLCDVSELGFVQNELSDCDVVSAIAQFFGFTAVVSGDMLILHDETCASRYYYRHDYDGQGWTSTGRQEGAFNDINGLHVHRTEDVTIERAYDGIIIKPSGDDEAIILPDICDDENLEGTGEVYTIEGEDAYPDHSEIRERMISKVFECGRAGDFSSHPPVNDRGWGNAAVFMRVVPRDTEYKYLANGGEQFSVYRTGGTKNYLWFRASDVSSDSVVARTKKSVSHPGGILRISLKFAVVHWGHWYNVNADPVELGDGVYFAGFLSIRCGNKYYYRDFRTDSVGVWKDYDGGSYFAMQDYRLLPTGLAQNEGTEDVLIKMPEGKGRIDVSIAWIGSPIWASYDNFFVEELSITGYGDDMNTEHPDLYHSFKGRTDEMLEVETHLTTRKSGHPSNDFGKTGINARPSVVSASKWCGKWHLTHSEDIPIAGCAMAQLKSVYGKPRLVRKDTREGRVRPYDRLAGNEFSVEAYEWDIFNNNTTIQYG